MTETKKNKIDSYLEELPGLVLTDDKMTFAVPEGTVGQGVLEFSPDKETFIEGLIQSGSTRIVLAEGTFAGRKCRVEFGLDARGLSRGDSFRGKIYLSGTIKPAVVSVRVNVVTAGESVPVPEGVKDLAAFTELCRKNMREGFRLFSRGDFEDLLTGKDAAYRLLYEGLSTNPVTYQHMEEFLVAAGCKEKLAFSLDREAEEEFDIQTSRKGTLYVYRSGWGYAHLDVSAAGRFLHVSKKTITTEDFIGKVYGLEYIIDYDALGDGLNNGTIRIEGVHQTLTFRISVSKGSRQYRPAFLEKQKKTAWLLRDLVNLRLHILDYPSWLESSKMTVAELIQAEEQNVKARLYRAFLAWSEEDKKTALEELMKLRPADGRLDDDEDEGFYLYLAKQTDLLPKEKRNILPSLMRFYARHQDSYILLNLIQREKDSILPVTKLKEMETCFNAGSTSPLLLLDAWNLIAGDEALLRSMSPFTIRVLGFGTRHNLMTESILSRAAYLSIVNMKRYSPALKRTFAGGYGKFGNRDVLEAILKLIILGQPLAEENFPWYEKAVEQDLRIVRLYEYYMETCPYTAEYVIPAPVRMYFAYNNTLGDRTKALLYASVVLHREQDSGTYSNYARQIRTFTSDSLARGRIDENYMILYREFYRFPDTKEKAEQAAAMIGARKFTCADPSIRNLVVRSGTVRDEAVYPLSEGTAYPRIPGRDSVLLMEDGMKRRFPLDSSCSLNPMAELDGTAEHCLQKGIDSSVCERIVCGQADALGNVTAENVRIYRLAAENPDFREEYRIAIRRKLLQYYSEHTENPGTEDFLGQMDVEKYGTTVKKEAAELLIREGFYQKAFQMVTTYGHEDIDEGLLVRLISRIILSLEMEGDEEALALAEAVYYAGKYDDVILCYLRDFHKGSAKDLARLWNKVSGFKLNAMNLNERILRRSMAEHSFPPYLGRILSSYIKGGGSHSLVRDYCAFLSARYFLNGESVPDELFGWTEQMLLGGWQLDRVCWMALLLHYTETDALTDRQLALAEQILAVLNERGYRFRFWQELPTKLAQEFSVDDKVFVETKVQGADCVELHYQILDKGSDTAEWKAEPMKNRYHGIYSREFLMFYGETLVYYLTVEKDGKVEKTPVGKAAPPETEAGGRTKYRLLNRMLRARDVGDAPALEEALQTYLWQSAYVDHYFKLM
ncbi:MAG: DUF5717 family protein [Eubacterium sp.]|nr:DUF5717 family protein [Eubacterium sp.]